MCDRPSILDRLQVKVPFEQQRNMCNSLLFIIFFVMNVRYLEIMKSNISTFQPFTLIGAFFF